MNNIYFPTTIVDGFFDYPDEVREYGLKQFAKKNIIKEEVAFYPGIRSKPLHELNPVLFEAIGDKIIKLFFRQDTIMQCDCTMHFQIVGKKYNSGWIHRDPTVATCIIYLTPNQHKNIGTSIYKQNNLLAEANLKQRELHPFSDNSLSSNKVEEEKNKAHSNFDEVIRVEGLYNRLLLFDGSVMHAAHNFVGDDADSSRMTIVCFFHGMNIGNQHFPITRSRTFQKYKV